MDKHGFKFRFQGLDKVLDVECPVTSNDENLILGWSVGIATGVVSTEACKYKWFNSCWKKHLILTSRTENMFKMGLF